MQDRCTFTVVNIFFFPVKKTISFFLLFILGTTVIVGCKKDTSLKNENRQVVIQGNLTLKVHAMHHQWLVPDLPVYLKKNSTSWPGTDSTKYELKTVTDVDGNCEFDHLFPGSYYLFAHGFDVNAGTDVIGYHAIELNVTTAPSNELNFTLNVSE